MKEIRVAIFEDNSNLRDGLYNLLEASSGFTCVGAFAHCMNAVANIEETRPDVILMDIEMPLVSGIEAVKKIKDKFPDAKILMETIFEDDDKIFQSICNGAEGYILKNTPPEEMLDAIKEIHEGGAPMTPSIASKVLAMFKAGTSFSFDESYNLTDREMEILKLLVDGMSYKMIAEKCFVSIDTVSTHVKNIYKKLHVSSRNEAVMKAIQQGLS